MACSLHPADSVSVAQSAVTCACTDSKAGTLPVSEAQQQHTQLDLLRPRVQPWFIWPYSKQVNNYIRLPQD